MKGNEYIRAVTAAIDRAWNTQREGIERAAELICLATERKSNIFVFGCSHAGIVAEEAFYRSGGLATVNPVFFPALMLNTRPVTMTSSIEKISGIARVLVEENGMKAGDVLVIHSVSGRNTVPVEMAEEAERRGINTVCITNLAYSRSVTSRAPSGKRLFEVCGTVIDNCGSVGDAEIQLEGLPEKIAPTSSAVGTALINGIIVEAVELMLERGTVPPVFMSANLDGGKEHNEKIFEDYGKNIFYM